MIFWHLLSNAVSFLIYHYHSTLFHLSLGDFYLSSFSVSSIFQPLTFIIPICYNSHFSQINCKILENGDFTSLMSASHIAYGVLWVRPHVDNRYSINIHWVNESKIVSCGQHDSQKQIYLKGTELFLSYNKCFHYSLVFIFLF